MNFLANENFPLLSIRLLRHAGHDVASIIEDASGAKDQAVLKRAHEEKRILLTFDRDYGELIYRNKRLAPAGVVYLRFGPSVAEEPAEILLNLIERGQVHLLGKFTVVERERIRQRTLP